MDVWASDLLDVVGIISALVESSLSPREVTIVPSTLMAIISRIIISS